MKRFILSILCVSVFCVGLGSIIEGVGARFKSDEKALGLIKQARIAIGGEPSLAEVRSMIIRGNSTHTFKMGSDTRTEQGETEIAMQLPDKLSKMVKIGKHDGAGDGQQLNSSNRELVIVRSGGDSQGAGVGGDKKVWVHRSPEGGAKVIDEKVIVKGENGEFTTDDGKKIILRTGGTGEGKTGEFTSKDGKKITIRTADGPEVEKIIVHGDGDHLKMAGHGERHNELLRTALSLLLTAPEGMDVSYTFAGEGDVDGTACNIVNASFAGSNIKLYLSKSSSLPVMVSYMGAPAPQIMHFRTKAPDGVAGDEKNVMFERRMEAPAPVEYNVRFSDYRGVGGVQLPFRWSTTVAGQPTETLDVTGYEINPSNIAEKFQNQKVMVRMKKDTN